MQAQVAVVGAGSADPAGDPVPPHGGDDQDRGGCGIRDPEDHPATTLGLGE